MRQPEFPPPFDVNLVGKQLEVCWPYKKDGKTVKIWASGRVKRVADGLKDTKSPRHKKICEGSKVKVGTLVLTPQPDRSLI